MRTEMKTAFRPSLESVEARIVATAGLVSAAHGSAVHVAAHHAGRVAAESHHHSTESHHAAPAPKHAAKGHSTQTNSLTINFSSSNGTSRNETTISSSTSTSGPSSKTSLATSPINGTTNQAWIELVNMTGQDLEYQLKLGPFADGQFLPFDIVANSSQFRMSSLIDHGQRVPADFAIRFGNGTVTPLMTGISQQSAQGYYIFLDGNGQYYVSPFFGS
jgi:hypothetical protein